MVKFRSLRSTVKMLLVTMYKLPLVLDTGLEYKGYYYFTTPQSFKPNLKKCTLPLVVLSLRPSLA